MENAVQEALWSGIGSMLFHAWPLLGLLLLLNLAKPFLKQKGRSRRNSTGRKPVGFFERAMPKVALSQGPFKAGDTLLDEPTRSTSSDRNYSEELMDQGDAYFARTHLMSPSERSVFKVLEKAYGDKYHIFCKVRVADLIQPNINKYHSRSRECIALFRQISQWHFGYVLCEKESLKIFCAIELDDPSLGRAYRVKRDRILNQECKSSGILLKRICVDHSEKKIAIKGDAQP